MGFNQGRARSPGFQAWGEVPPRALDDPFHVLGGEPG
jgi:hypothetical protein